MTSQSQLVDALVDLRIATAEDMKDRRIAGITAAVVRDHACDELGL